jgi:hypothetical protein
MTVFFIKYKLVRLLPHINPPTTHPLLEEFTVRGDEEMIQSNNASFKTSPSKHYHNNIQYFKP